MLFAARLLVIVVGGSFCLAVYTIVAEYRRGQTVGKRLIGLRVVREIGRAHQPRTVDRPAAADVPAGVSGST